MKKFKFLKSLINPKQMIRYKDMNIIIAICIFVIFAFLLGAPISQKAVVDSEEELLDNYNYQVFNEIPNTDEINNVISELISKECSVNERRILECKNFSEGMYSNTISFVNDKGIKKNILFVIDLFDIKTVYIGQVDINYEAKNLFTIKNYPYEENTENYLLRFASDSLYFQAHPFDIEKQGIRHDDNLLKAEVAQIYYQNLLPDFSINSKNTNVNNFSDYILDQLIIGNYNTTKLKSYTLVFLVGVCFTLITIIILWIFFRKNGKIVNFSEYYNIAAITSLPISIIFFILLWFVPSLIYIYIFIFSGIYVIVLYRINSTEEIV